MRMNRKMDLFSAIKRGVNDVKRVLDDGADVNVKSEGWPYETALIAALKTGNVEIVKLLLNQGADINMTHDTQGAALSYAIQKGEEDLITLLLDNGANVYDTRRYDGTTILQLAARSGNEKIFQMILDRGVELLTTNSDGKTTLHFAAIGKNEKVVKFLLDQGANVHDVDSYGNTSLYYAVHSGNEKIVRLFLELGVQDINARFKHEGKTALHIACEFGFDHVIKLLLNYNADIETMYDSNVNYTLPFLSSKSNALSLAIKSCNSEECVKILLDHGADVDKIAGDSPIQRPVLTALDCLQRPLRNSDGSFLKTEKNYRQMKQTTVLEQLLVYGANVGLSSFCYHTLVHHSHGDDYKYCAEILMPYIQDIDIDVPRLEVELTTHVINKNGGYSMHPIGYTETLVKHLVKLDSKNAEEVFKIHYLQKFKRQCEEELEKLKAETFEDSLISFYDYMTTKDHNQLASYLRNEAVVRGFTSETYQTTFPIYQLTLHSQFRRGMWRKLMLDRVKRFFHAVADYEGNEHLPKLPWTCNQKILFQLSNKDLRMLIQVCNPVDGFNIYNVE